MDLKTLKEKLKYYWPYSTTWGGYIRIDFYNRELHFFCSPLSLVYSVIEKYGLPKKGGAYEFVSVIRALEDGDRMALTSVGGHTDLTPEISVIEFHTDLLAAVDRLARVIDFSNYNFNEEEFKKWDQHSDLREMKSR